LYLLSGLIFIVRNGSASESWVFAQTDSTVLLIFISKPTPNSVDFLRFGSYAFEIIGKTNVFLNKDIFLKFLKPTAS
jgi:hypothetical protein